MFDIEDLGYLRPMLYYVVIHLFCKIKVLRWLENIFFAKNSSICLKEKASFRKQNNKQKKSKDLLEQKSVDMDKANNVVAGIDSNTDPILLYLVILMDVLGLTDDFNECPRSQKCFH